MLARVPEGDVEKGDRVVITGGRKGVGVRGVVFWKGPDKFGHGDRFGVEGDDGSTYWVSGTCLAPDEQPPHAAPEVVYQRGDRVYVLDGDDRIEGEVFWVGESRRGGQRLGIRPVGASTGEAWWRDARQVCPCAVEGRDDTADVGPSVEPDGMDPIPPELVGRWSSELPPEPPVDEAWLDGVWPPDEEVGRP